VKDSQTDLFLTSLAAVYWQVKPVVKREYNSIYGCCLQELSSEAEAEVAC